MEYKWYHVNYGCMGHIGNGNYRLFATDSEYSEWYENACENNDLSNLHEKGR